MIAAGIPGDGGETFFGGGTVWAATIGDSAAESELTKTGQCTQSALLWRPLED
jgi:hypothetical protein